MENRIIKKFGGSMCRHLPMDEPIDTTPDINQWLLSRTRKRLKRMGLNSRLRLHKTEFVEWRLNSDRLMDIISELKWDLNRFFHEPQIIIMGHEQFEDVMNLSMEHNLSYGAYTFPVDLRKEPEHRILGLKVNVVPGFDGFAMIPKRFINN